MKPTARSSSSPHCATESGFDSAVTSASGVSPNSAPIAATTDPRSAALSRVGVPPPKNTVDTGRSASPSTRRACLISAIAWAA